MPRRRPAELHVNHERWLVSYADFITLLFAFFVVMYSISQVNESKYRVLSDTLMDAFEPARNLNPIQVGELSRSPSTSAIDIRGDERGDTRQPALGELGERISAHFAHLIGDGLVTVQANEYWLQIELRDSILFGSGSAELSAQAQKIFSEMAGLLSAYDNPVQIEGHTDNQPISNVRYPSNWELSAARASAIVKLLTQADVSPSRLSAVGYGEHQPSASNNTPEGRAENRRVTLMIAREAIERPRASLDPANSGSLPPREPPHRGQPDAGAPDATQAPGETADNPAVSAPVDTAVDAGENPSEPTSQAAEQRDEQSTGPVSEPTIEPVKLESGGLLFSSDPDLPRQP